VAGKLEDYGAIFVTSASPSKSKVQARLEIHDRMESIRRRLEKRTGMRLWAGVGATLPPGDQLLESRRQAVSALSLCASLQKNVVFFEDHPGPINPKWSRGLRMALRQLLKSHLRGSDQEKESARAEYMRQALLYSHERGESLRAHLLEAVFILTESLRDRLVLGDESDILIDALEERLQNALAIRDMLTAFREGLEGFARIGTKPSEGKRLAGMEQMKQYVDEHFAEPLRITELAARMDLSKPAFLKNFRLRTGQGFSQYLQNRRLEEAKLMLRSGSLSIARVAQECGFNSSSYFIQAFRRLAHISPGQYRGKGKR
jgi:AraC-like DNA-binding protein